MEVYFPPVLSHLTLQSMTQKLQQLQARVHVCRQKLDHVESEQSKMHLTADEVEKDFQELEEEQNQAIVQQEALDKKMAKVEKKQIKIRLWERALSQSTRVLSNLAAFLIDDQKKVDAQLLNVENLRQTAEQRVALMHQNLLAIEENLQEAELAGENIEEKHLIEEYIEEIEELIVEIKGKKEEIEEIVLRIPIPEGVDMGFDPLEGVGIEEGIEKTVPSVFGRIQEICKWILGNVCLSLAEANQKMIQWAASSNFSLENPTLNSAISWIALGALASTGMHDITFSFDDFNLRSSFREFTWIKKGSQAVSA